MNELIPSILVESEEEFERRLRLVDGHVKTVHIDILDGTMFPQTSWFDARAVGAIETPVVYELHLMVENPLPIIKEWSEHVKQLKRAIIHLELDRPISTLLEDIKQWYKIETGLALNPETPIEEIKHHTEMLDALLVMGVHPGASSQPFLGDAVIEKIRSLHHYYPQLPIGCDGGITPELAPSLIEAGCSRLVVASGIFRASNPTETIKNFLPRSTIDR